MRSHHWSCRMCNFWYSTGSRHLNRSLNKRSANEVLDVVLSSKAMGLIESLVRTGHAAASSRQGWGELVKKGSASCRTLNFSTCAACNVEANHFRIIFSCILKYHRTRSHYTPYTRSALLRFLQANTTTDRPSLAQAFK